MLEEIKKIKKIELHLHLDGSVSPLLAQKLTNLTLNEIKNEMQAPSKCLNLRDYLTRFELPIKLMQTSENLKLIATDLVNRLEKDNVIYAEIRFAPMSHICKGLTYEEIVESVLAGLKTSTKVKTNLILCMRRGFSKEENIKTIEIAYKYLNKGVVAIDLVGDEANYKLKEYLELFKLAKEKNIPFTIHAGEVDYLDIIDAIDLGAKRLGHGVKCIDKKELIELIKKKNVLLEICPTSNIQTNAFFKYQDHPIYKLYKDNVNISINTDNMTVSNINLNDEYMNLITNFKFKIKDLKKINRNAVNYTFLTAKEKIELLELLDKDN